MQGDLGHFIITLHREYKQATLIKHFMKKLCGIGMMIKKIDLNLSSLLSKLKLFSHTVLDHNLLGKAKIKLVITQLYDNKEKRILQK